MLQPRVPGVVDLPHAALADLGGNLVDAEAEAWAEGHGKMARVYRSGPSGWLSKAHVRMLSDDPVELRGQGGGQAGRRQRPLWDSYPRQSQFLLDPCNDNVRVLGDIDGKYTLWLLQRGKLAG